MTTKRADGRNGRNGSTTAWRKVRAAQLQRQPWCEIRGPRCQGRADQVHHTLGWSVTGDDPRYLQSVCGACHGPIGKPEGDPPAAPRTSW